jgi:CubicO group peptidase (beta-lactamase class C family)
VRDQREDRSFGLAVTRREAVAMGIALAASGMSTAGSIREVSAVARRQGTPEAGAPDDRAEAIVALARDVMAKNDLKAVIVRVTIDGQEVVTTALGESMTGVPATPEMNFRNGAVTYSYMATLVLRLVDQKVVGLDDSLATWLPDLRDADRVTLRMLTNMTAGYPDYVQNPGLDQQLYADPFRQWTNQELIALGLSTPQVFEPGTNWDYSHTNWVILGEALEKIGDKPLDVLLQEEVLTPMGLPNTVNSDTASIPEPVLHAFTSERKQTLGIPASTPFYEECTYWNPSWSLAKGAVQTTDIIDLATTAVAVGEGTILSPESHQEQIAGMMGFGTPVPGCANCRTLNEQFNYGLGVVLHGKWILQNPLFAGYGAIGAYLPARKIAVAVAMTYGENSFDDAGNYGHDALQDLFEAIGGYLAPEDMPPSR